MLRNTPGAGHGNVWKSNGASVFSLVDKLSVVILTVLSPNSVQHGTYLLDKFLLRNAGLLLHSHHRLLLRPTLQPLQERRYPEQTLKPVKRLIYPRRAYQSPLARMRKIVA